jgi:site-specific DNA-cytosine methylase
VLPINVLLIPKGCVDVICGGPPCQGISGLNRFRKHEDPLTDERNKQLVVFMDIVKYLRPKYVLMENVVDILKFADGFLGRYALSRLVAMSYQARLGMLVAGCYGLPQFRMRAFLWGALPSVVPLLSMLFFYLVTLLLRRFIWQCRYFQSFRFPPMMLLIEE